jgi:carbonic anhydrase
MAHGKFGTVLNCMDGRTQEPVLRWMKSRFDLDYVDNITEPGPDQVLLAGDEATRKSVRRKLDISLRGHGSKVVAVIGHTDCAGNPVDDEKHLSQIQQSVAALEQMHLGVPVLGLWLDENWTVRQVAGPSADD